MSWTMPPEWAEQERVWMAFPPGGYTLGETEADADAARGAWAGVANTIVDFEPVTMLVAPGQEALARRFLDARVELVAAELDDAWMRDIGPTFVTDGDRLGAVDWVFNGWGQQDWASWGHDAGIGRLVARLAGAELVESPMVNEGGGIHVDGAGAVLATRSVQLDPLRNPGWSERRVEAELARTLGAERTLWLSRGLARDTERYGTKGHVDIVAAFAGPDTLLLHAQPDPRHPDHAIMRDIRAELEPQLATLDRELRVVDVPAPVRLEDAEGFVDFSYINHLVVNGAVIACAFDDPSDAVARGVLADAYPGREVVSVPATEIFARGGGIHCITQQQPRV